MTPDYPYYYLQHAKKLAIELASGTSFLEISGKKAAQIPIPIAPLDEQREIVAEIEKQFTRLDAGNAGLTEQSTRLVQKLWNYCNILRDDLSASGHTQADGLSYGDCVELTFLLFLKMADEQSRGPFNKSSPIPKEFAWQSLLKRDGCLCQ